MKKWRRTTAVVFMVLGITFGIVHSAMGVITDMAGHWAGPLMAALEARGIVSGDDLGRLNPDTPLTRAQLAKLFVDGLGHDADAQLLSRYDSRFTDIPGWHWAKGYIESLAEMSVTDGYPDGSFGPSDTVTRAQMAVFLVRVMGLQDEAWRQQLAPTLFADDQDIPAWARGAVHVALANGLMNGASPDVFAPQRPITKAEGGVALLRLMGRLGRAYNLTGTLVKFDSTTLRGVVRDQLGQETAFAMAPSAQYFRGGAATQVGQIQLEDQVWIVYGSSNQGALLEARYSDLTGTNAVVQGQQLTIVGPDRVSQTLSVQPGAQVFLNGRPSTLAQLQGVPQVYLAIDGETGEVRVADGVNAPISGRLAIVDKLAAALTVVEAKTTERLLLAPDAVLFLNGKRVTFGDLLAGDQVRVAVNGDRAITYLQVER